MGDGRGRFVRTARSTVEERTMAKLALSTPAAHGKVSCEELHRTSKL
jgi:hypothetical protein